jgi:hypothetical protein
MSTPRHQSTEYALPRAAANAAAGTGRPLTDHNGCSHHRLFPPGSTSLVRGSAARSSPQIAEQSRQHFRINQRIHEK